MFIKRIQASIKGRSHDLTFSKPIAAIIGDNGTGKTSIPIAINLALRGYEPSVAKSDSTRNNAAHRILAGPEGVLSSRITTTASAEETTENGEWSYELTKDGRTWKPERELSSEEISLMSPENFFNASGPDRLSYALSVSDTTLTAEEITRRMSSIASDWELCDPSEEIPPGPIALLNTFTAYQKNRISVLRSEIKLVETELKTLGLDLASRPLMDTEREDVEKIRDNLLAKERTRYDLERRESRLLDDIKKAREAREALGEIDSGDTEQLESMEAELDNLLEEYRDAKSVKENTISEGEEIARRIKAADRKTCPECGQAIEGNRENVEELREELESIRMEAQRIVAEMTQTNERIEEIRREVRDFRRRLNKGGESRELEGRIKAKREDLKKIQDELNEVGEWTATDNEELRRTSDLLKQQDRLVASKTKAETRERDLKEFETEMEARKAILKVCGEMKTEIVSSTFKTLFGPGIEVMQEVLPWFRLEADLSGDLGYFRDDRWIPSGSWSGSETLAAYCILAISIAAKSKGFRLVVIDEVGRFSKDRQRRLVEALQDAWSEDKIDQAILLGPSLTVSSEMAPEVSAFTFSDKSVTFSES